MDGTTTVGPRRLAVLCLLLPLLTVLPLFAFAWSLPAPEATGWLMVLVLPAVLAAPLPRPAFRSILFTILGLVLMVVSVNPVPAPVAAIALLVNLSSVAAAAVVTRRIVGATDRALDRIRRRTELDQLTGVLNRRGLERNVASVFAPGVEVTVAAVDLDQLKYLNDRFGHDAGDRALTQVAVALQRAVPGGLVARVGGDEFQVVVAGTDPTFGARVRSHLDQVDRPVTVSIGTATGPLTDDTAASMDSLVRSADLQLYQEKSVRRPLPDLPAPTTGDPTPDDGEQTVFGPATRRLLAMVAGTFAVLALPGIIFADQLVAFGETLRPEALLVSAVLDLIIVYLLLRPGPNRRTLAPALLVAMLSLAVMSFSGSGQFLATAVWVVPMLPAFQVLGTIPRTAMFAGVAAIRLWVVVQSSAVSGQAMLVAVVQLAVIVTVVCWLWRLHVRSGRVRATLVELSRTDPLTGLLNRGGVERAVAERGWGWVTATVLDVDRFKRVNDQQGHAAGDQVLVELTRTLHQRWPEHAVIGRLGGDEFVVVHPTGLVLDDVVWPVPVTSGSAEGPVRSAAALWELVRRADLELLSARRDRGESRERSTSGDHS